MGTETMKYGGKKPFWLQTANPASHLGESGNEFGLGYSYVFCCENQLYWSRGTCTNSLFNTMLPETGGMTQTCDLSSIFEGSRPLSNTSEPIQS